MPANAQLDSGLVSQQYQRGSEWDGLCTRKPRPQRGTLCLMLRQCNTRFVETQHTLKIYTSPRVQRGRTCFGYSARPLISNKKNCQVYVWRIILYYFDITSVTSWFRVLVRIVIHCAPPNTTTRAQVLKLSPSEFNTEEVVDKTVLRKSVQVYNNTIQCQWPSGLILANVNDLWR